MGYPLRLVPLHPVLWSSIRFMTCSWPKLRGKLLQNCLHNMVDSIIGYCLAGRMLSLPHRLSSTVEPVSLYVTAVLLCDSVGIHQDDKGNEYSSPKAVWMSVSKQIQEVNKPDPHSLVISRKTEGEETDCLPRTGWNANWIFLLAFENVDIFICPSFLHVLHSQLASHPK